MTYTSNWFKNNINNWSKWLSKFKGTDNLKFLEIGCFEGRATVWLLENILIGKNCEISAIDTFEGSMENTNLEKSNIEKNYEENILPFADQVLTHKGLSQIILREFKVNDNLRDRDFFDFIYIDGSHIAPDVLEDTVLSWRLLKKGGIMIFDDYGWHKYKDLKMCPAMAIDSFLSIFEGQYKLISKGYQVCIEKL